MKYLLSLSLILNAILVYRLYTEGSKPALERIVVEEKVVNRIEPRIPHTEVPIVPKQAMQHANTAYDKPVETAPSSYEPVNMEDWQDEVDKVETAKRRFFENEGIDTSVMDKVTKIKFKFQKQQQALMDGTYPGELPLEKRRQLIDLEEKYQKDLELAFGKKKWEKFQAFKNRYNQSMFKKLSNNEGTARPYVPMDI